MVTEQIIQKFVLQESDVFIIVVDQLTLSDQKLIRNICSDTNYKDKDIIIVHNFSRLDDEESLKRQIKLDIESVFSVRMMDNGDNANSFKNLDYSTKTN